jgi:pimeloyl-ACP methyl ester carboxylesterase
MKNARFIGYENSGHLPWLDKPEQHAKEINSFLS